MEHFDALDGAHSPVGWTELGHLSAAPAASRWSYGRRSARTPGRSPDSDKAY